MMALEGKLRDHLNICTKIIVVEIFQWWADRLIAIPSKAKNFSLTGF